LAPIQNLFDPLFLKLGLAATVIVFGLAATVVESVCDMETNDGIMKTKIKAIP